MKMQLTCQNTVTRVILILLMVCLPSTSAKKKDSTVRSLSTKTSYFKKSLPAMSMKCDLCFHTITRVKNLLLCKNELLHLLNVCLSAHIFKQTP